MPFNRNSFPHPTADANGTISYSEAVQFAWNRHDPDLNFLEEFARDYGRLMGERIDLGELQQWHWDLVLERCRDLVRISWLQS